MIITRERPRIVVASELPAELARAGDVREMSRRGAACCGPWRSSPRSGFARASGIAAPPGGGGFGDMPDIGWTPTLVTQRDGSTLSQSGWGLDQSENLSLITTATDAPLSPNTAIRETTPQNFPGGSSSTGQFYEPIHASAPRRILTRDVFRFDPLWNLHPTSTNKRAFATMSGANSFYTCAWGSSASAVFFGVGLQGLFSASGLPLPDVLSQNLNQGGQFGGQITLGAWQIYWTEITGNTAGQEDARVRQWVDGGSGPVLTVDQTGFAFKSTAAVVDAVNITTMRGGGGTPNPSACWIDTDDFTLWRDAA
jgi:hypothetical protein